MNRVICQKGSRKQIEKKCNGTIFKIKCPISGTGKKIYIKIITDKFRTPVGQQMNTSGITKWHFYVHDSDFEELKNFSLSL